MLQMGQMMFTDSKSWNDEYKGPAMMAPPLYAMMVLVTAIGTLLLYLIMQWSFSRQQRYSALPESSKEVDAEEKPHDSRQFADFSLDDSANETSDGAPSHGNGMTSPTTAVLSSGLLQYPMIVLLKSSSLLAAHPSPGSAKASAA